MSDEYAPLYPVFTRVCLRCKQPINGYGFYTLYGYIFVNEKRIHGCGDPVHHKCPRTGARRETFFDDGTERTAKPRRAPVLYHFRRVAPGIFYNEHTMRYNVRANKKRLGSHPTLERAQAAQTAYLKLKQGGNNAVSKK